MNPEELRDTLRHQPFEPFRLVMTDGAGYEIRHPDLLWVGRSTAMVGLTGEPGQTFYFYSGRKKSLKCSKMYLRNLGGPGRL